MGTYITFLPGGLVQLAPQLYVGKKEPTPKKLLPVKNPVGINNKPWHGLWTSTRVANGSGWTNWCSGESFGRPPNGWLLRPTPAKVYVVHEVADLEELTRSFPGGYPRDLMLASYSRPQVNFEAAAEEFDAIHLTEEGQWATRFSEPSFYGWDCECTMWFRWCFGDVEPLGVIPETE
jgi:hypothetical protein